MQDAGHRGPTLDTTEVHDVIKKFLFKVDFLFPFCVSLNVPFLSLSVETLMYFGVRLVLVFLYCQHIGNYMWLCLIIMTMSDI